MSSISPTTSGATCDLEMGRRRDIDGVRRPYEPGGVEIRVRSGRRGPVGPESGKGARRRGPDAAQLPWVGGRRCRREDCGPGRCQTCLAGQDLLGREGLATIHPGQEGAHVGWHRARPRGVAGPAAIGPAPTNGWPRSMPPARPDAAPTSTSDRAMESAPVQVLQDCSGDHRNRCRSWPRLTEPDGSKSMASSEARGAATVASSTSVLVEVETTAPLAASTLGMINEVVLPERGEDRGSSPNVPVERSANHVHRHRGRHRVPRSMTRAMPRDEAE